MPRRCAVGTVRMPSLRRAPRPWTMIAQIPAAGRAAPSSSGSGPTSQAGAWPPGTGTSTSSASRPASAGVG